jgi:hypothetical protein
MMLLKKSVKTIESHTGDYNLHIYQDLSIA